LQQAKEALSGSPISLGAQNVSEQDMGAFTGEVSAKMLTDFDVKFCIVGHSERRSLYSESSDVVALKAEMLLKQDIKPIICVGETLDERDGGMAFEVVREQLGVVLQKIGPEGIDRSIIAYEPVWAIGTGRVASPEQAQEVHAVLRDLVGSSDKNTSSKVRILYGGSVKPENAGDLFAMEDIDGGLIGGASLKVEDFAAICAAVV
jgi:triosephosphate isomerase